MASGFSSIEQQNSGQMPKGCEAGPLRALGKDQHVANSAQRWRRDLRGHLGLEHLYSPPPGKGTLGVGGFGSEQTAPGKAKRNECLPLQTAVGESCSELSKKRNSFNLDPRLNQIKRWE